MSLARTLFWSGLVVLGGLWIASVAVALSSAGLHVGGFVKGSGHALTQTRSLSAFERIADHGSIDVEVSVGGAQRVEVEADDNVVPRVETVVRDGTLVISERGSFSSRTAMNVKVVVPALEALSLSGSGDAKIDGLEGRSLEVTTSGSGEVTASGKVERLHFSSFGSGGASFAGLEVGTATVRLNGSGDARLNVRDELDVQIFGSGDVTYSGSPHVTKKVFGSGDVSRAS